MGFKLKYLDTILILDFWKLYGEFKINFLKYSIVKNISKSTILFTTLKDISWKDIFYHFYINKIR